VVTASPCIEAAGAEMHKQDYERNKYFTPTEHRILVLLIFSEDISVNKVSF
jgi:hypothetical protein